MALSLYDISIPVYRHWLDNLSDFLDRGAAHAKSAGAAPQTLLDARLAPDMHPLTFQVHAACHHARMGASRLAGLDYTQGENPEVTIPELKAKIAATIAFLDGFQRGQLAGREDVEIQLVGGGVTRVFAGNDFALHFSVPNFLFHVVTAYGLLRGQGVPLGKLDYLAGPQFPRRP